MTLPLQGNFKNWPSDWENEDGLAARVGQRTEVQTTDGIEVVGISLSKSKVSACGAFRCVCSSVCVPKSLWQPSISWYTPSTHKAPV